MSAAPKKRSRFDMTQEEARRSRHDEPDSGRRRSRSPDSQGRSSDPRRRERSPQSEKPQTPTDSKIASASERAKAIAAKMAADIEAKKAAGIIPAVSAPKAIVPSSGMSESDAGETSKGGDIYEQDGDFIKDIEVNDLKNRYTLTKGPFHKEVFERTGADVTVRGAFYPNKAMATAAQPPLYLHITARTKEALEKAIAIIEDRMTVELPNLMDERRNPGARRREPDVERDERGRRKWPEEKIPIHLEPINGFNIRAQVVGQGGSYVKHIQQESGARVQIKGQGSGFFEHDTGMESDQPMYLHVTAPQQAQVDQAKELCISLLESVETQYQEHKERGGHFRRGGNRDGGPGRDHSGYGGNNSYGGGGDSYNAYGMQAGGAQSPPNAGYGAQAAAPGFQQQQQLTAEQQQQYMAWAQWEVSDPSAFQAYMQASPETYQWYAACKSYYAQQAAYQGGGAAAAQGYQSWGGEAAPGQHQHSYDANGAYGAAPGSGGGGGAAPPPPPPGDDDAPPPPPPGAGGRGSMSAVPPPPGL